MVAPTGIAALNVDGYTIHRLFGFRTTTTLADVTGGVYRPGRFAKTLASLDTLIIDEASMVRADVFDMVATALQRFGPDPGAPLGACRWCWWVTSTSCRRWWGGRTAVLLDGLRHPVLLLRQGLRARGLSHPVADHRVPPAR